MLHVMALKDEGKCKRIKENFVNYNRTSAMTSKIPSISRID